MAQCLRRGLRQSFTIMQFLLSFLMLSSVFKSFPACSSQEIISPYNGTFPAVIAFGDSVIDTGTNNNLATIAKCNFPPYGKDLKGGKPTGRFSNGKVPVDLIAEGLGIKQLLPSYLDPTLQTADLVTGVNFASGAGGYDPLTAQISTVLSLTDQLELFKEYLVKLKGVVGEERTTTILSNSVYGVLTGSNDITITYFTTPRRFQYDFPAYADLMVSYASSFIQELLKLGARRIAVFSIPPIGCVPSQRTLRGGPSRVCFEEYNQEAQLVNTKLSSEVDVLGQKYTQSRIVYVDIYHPLLDLIQHPQNYGFEVADRGCCGTGVIEVTYLCNKYSKICPDDSKYLFWDSFHPTERGYTILVQQILEKVINRFL